MEVERIRKRPANNKQRKIQFVRQCESTADTRAAICTSLLDRGNGWELRMDLDRKLVF